MSVEQPDTSNELRFLNPAGPPAEQYSNAAILPAGRDTVWIAGQLPLNENEKPRRRHL